MSLSREAIREQLRGFSREELAAFVVDLWQERGREGDRVDGRLMLGRGQSRTPRTASVLPTGEETAVTEDVDVVILASDSSAPEMPKDVEVLGPADLSQLVRYAVDADASERLLSAHFDLRAADQDVEAKDDADDAPAEGTSSSPATGRSIRTRGSVSESDEGVGPRSPNHMPGVPDPPPGATGVGLSGSVAAVDGGAGSDATQEGGGRSTTDGRVVDGPFDLSSESTSTGTGSPGPTRRTVLIGGGTLLAGLGVVGATQLSATAEPSISAPGLTDGGVTDPTALAEAHASALEGTSYALTVRRVVTRADRRLRSFLSMDLALAADRSFLTRVATAGPEAPRFIGEPPASRVYWSDGSEYLARSADESTSAFRSFEPPGIAGTWRYWAWMVPFGGTYRSRPERYYQTLFEAVPTTLAGSRTVNGDPVYDIVEERPSIEEDASMGAVGLVEEGSVTLDATIAPDGIVRSVDVEYEATADGDRVDVHRTVEYTAIDDTQVERPDS